MSNREVVLVGYSGHGYVVADAALKSKIKLDGYLDKEKKTLNPFKLKYLGDDNILDNEFWKKDVDFILGIGDNSIRRKIVQTLISKEKNILNVLHPQANISSFVTIGSGNYIAQNANINTLVHIGNYTICNTGCIIEHECIIGDYVHIAPGAVLAGNVTIGNNSFIGANSVIKQGVEIGENVIVGAGSVILKDVANNSKVAGNPAKVIR